MKHFFLLLCLTLILSANQKISLQLEWKHQFEFAGFYAAKEQGYYNDIGVDLELRELKKSINITDEVLKGNVDFGVSSSSLILDKLDDKDVVLVASYFKQNALALITSKDIKSLQDLKNKKIMATTNEIIRTSLSVMLNENGLNKGDYEFIEHEFNVDKFVNGDVDAMSVFITSQLYLLDEKGIEYNLFTPADFGIFSYDLELFTSNTFADSHQKLVKDFIQASRKGWEYAFAHKQEVVDLIYDKYSQKKSKKALMYEAEQIHKLFKTEIFAIGSIVSELVILNAVIYKKLGLVKKGVNLNGVLNDYVFNKNYTNYNKIVPISEKLKLTQEQQRYLKDLEPIKIANEMDWAPFDYNEFGKPTGMSIEYIELLFDKLGLKYTFVNGYTWSELLSLFKKGEIDVIPAIYKTQKRAKYTNFTNPYYQGSLTLYTLKDSSLKTDKDFKNKKIGIEASDASLIIIKKYYPYAKIIELTSSKTLFQNLQEKKVDAIICNELLMRHYLKSQKNVNIVAFKNLNLTAKEKQITSLYVGVNKQRPLLHTLLEKAINTLSYDEVTKLQDRWIKEKNHKHLKLTKSEQEYLKNKQINMCIDPDWMPFESFDNGVHVGMSADFFDIIQKNIHKNINVIKTSSWSESIEFAKKRKCDIFSLAMETPERKKYMNFTTPYLNSPLVLATKTDVPFVNDFLGLQKKRVGITKGYAFIEILKAKYPNLNIIEVENIHDGLMQVKNGTLFGYIGTLASVGYLFQTDFVGELKIAGKFDEKWELGIGVRNDDKILFSILQKAIDSIDENEKREILNNWIAIKYEQSIDYTFLWRILILVTFLILVTLYWLRKLSQLNKKLESAKRVAENATLAKANFLANMSHEIRTPMNSIVGMSYLLKETNLNKVQYEYVQKVETASNNLMSLINDILDFSKIEVHKLEIRNINFNLLEVLNNVENILKVKSFQKELELKITYDTSYSMHLYGDSMRLSQVLINLLSNAIKFTEKGSVELLIQKKTNTLFRFSVIDTGIGLRDEQKEEIFSSFTQADSSITRKYGGTGLGLAIAKELIELMDGRIWVESTLDKGSKFIFEIKLELSKEDISPLDVDRLQEELINVTRPLLDNHKSDELFSALKISCQKRRPQLCAPILKELEMYKLDDSDKKLLLSATHLIKKYKFDEARTLLDEK